MMTVKIVTTETDGGERVYLFPAARVQYRVTQLNNPNANDGMPPRTFGDVSRGNNPQYVVSGLQNLDVKQNMQMAWVYLNDEEGGLAPMIVSSPATCYIMVDGKTIDRFRLDFLE